MAILLLMPTWPPSLQELLQYTMQQHMGREAEEELLHEVEGEWACLQPGPKSIPASPNGSPMKIM